MKARGYKTADAATNFTDIRVRLQKRDLIKVGLTVVLVEMLLRTPLSKETRRWLTQHDSLLFDRIDDALKKNKDEVQEQKPNP